MANYITHASPQHFQPMNANFGIMPGLGEKKKTKQLRNLAIADKALAALADFQASTLTPPATMLY